MGASLLNFRMNMVHSPYGRCVPSSLRQNASIGVAKMWWWESRDMILKSLLQTKKVKNNRNSSDHVSKGQIVSAGNWYQRIPYIGQWPKSRNCVRQIYSTKWFWICQNVLKKTIFLKEPKLLEWTNALYIKIFSNRSKCFGLNQNFFGHESKSKNVLKFNFWSCPKSIFK